MKALWSRTGLSHRCGCRACDQVVQGAGRPTAKNAAVRGRKPNYANRVAFYSSMLCTATIVDTVRKDQRAHEIDAEIKKVGDEVKRMKTRRQERLEQIEYAKKHFLEMDTTPCDADQAQNMILWDHMERMYVNLPASQEIVWAPKLAPSNMIDDLRRKHYGIVDTATDRWSHARAQIDRIINEVQAEEVDPNVVTREPKTQPQFERKRDSVLRMVTGLLGGAERLRLLRLLKIDNTVVLEGGRDYYAIKKWLTDNVGAGWEVNPDSQRGSQSYRERLLRVANVTVEEFDIKADQVMDEAWQLLDNNDTNWSLDNWNAVNARQTTLDLNAHIRWLFQQEDLPLDIIIGHICNNILLSPYLPDIHTFNLLMAEFAKRREQKLFRSVYKEYMRSRMMSTPATQSINVLAQAMFTSHIGLRRAIASVLGWDQKHGAKIATTEILPLRSKHRREYLHAMSPVYLPFRDSLISTLLSFHLFESAAAMFLACVRAHVSIGWEVIQRVFEAHIEALDWEGSMLLIRGVSVMDYDFGYLLRTTLTKSEAKTACQHLHSLLDFVGVHWNKNGKITMSQQNLEERGLDSSRLDTLRRTMMHFGVDVTIQRFAKAATFEEVALGSRVLQLESIDKELNRVRKNLYTLEAKFCFERRSHTNGAATLYSIGREHVKKTGLLLNEFLKIQSNLEPGSNNQPMVDNARKAILADDLWLSKHNDDGAMLEDRPVHKTARKLRRPFYDKAGYFPADGIRMRSNPKVLRHTQDTPVNRLEGWRTLPKVRWDPSAGSSIRALAARKAQTKAFAAEVAAHISGRQPVSKTAPIKSKTVSKAVPVGPKTVSKKREMPESDDAVTAALMSERRGMRDEGTQVQQQASRQAQPLQTPQYKGNRFSDEDSEEIASRGNRFSAEAASG